MVRYLQCIMKSLKLDKCTVYNARVCQIYSSAICDTGLSSQIVQCWS